MKKRCLPACCLLITAALIITACGQSPTATATPTVAETALTPEMEEHIIDCIKDIQDGVSESLEVLKVYVTEDTERVYVAYMDGETSCGAIYSYGNTTLYKGEGVTGYSLYQTRFKVIQYRATEVGMRQVNKILASAKATPTPSPTRSPLVLPTPSLPAPSVLSPDKQAWYEANRESLQDKTLKSFVHHTDKETKAATYAPKGRQTLYSSTGKTVTVDPKFTVYPGGKIIFLTYIGFTRNEWIYFNRILFWVDMKEYTVVLGKYETERGKLPGAIHEDAVFTTKDEILLTPIEYGKTYASTEMATRMVQLLIDICNSKKTMIQFHGEKGDYIRTLSQAEKNAIKQTLILYACMAYRPTILDELGMIPEE